MQRVANILAHLQPGQNSVAAPVAGSAKSPDDIVICSALRTAIGRAKKGSFKDTHPADLLSAVLKGVVSATKLDPKLVNDIQVGNVLAPGGFAIQARMAAFLAGFPDTTAVSTTNRQCSSGLQAVATVASAISAGYYDIGIAAGVESMSQNAMGASSVGELSDKVFENAEAKDCLVPMGITSENVAEKYGISRQVQDEFSVQSHAKAGKAQAEGRFKAEIVPVTTKIVGEDGNEKQITVTKDDGPRPDTTLAGLTKLKPAFTKEGSTTAGNSSQVSDGAAAVLLMKRKTANALGLPIVGVFKGFSAVGVPPAIMGIGPAAAIPALLKKTGVAVNDVDVYEINEAFASQASYCVKNIGINPAKVNPNGGAIALGHPLGCTGARQVATLLAELKRSNGKLGVVSMCIGTGMGAAALFAAE